MFEVGNVLADLKGFVALGIILLQSLVGFQSLGVVAHDFVGHAQFDEEHGSGEVVGVLLGGLVVVSNGILLVTELQIAVADES